MSDGTARWDRRGEVRYRLKGRIFWRRATRNMKVLGYLLDTSQSSVSFQTAHSNRPARGDEIELVDASDAKQRCRVTRTADLDRQRSLIACQNADGSKAGTSAIAK